MLDYLRAQNWPERWRQNSWWLVLVLGLLGGCLYYVYQFQPAWSRYQDASLQLLKHRTELQEMQGVQVSVESARRFWKRIQGQFGLELFNARTEDEQDVAVLSFFYRVQRHARESGVVLQDLNQRAEKGLTVLEDKNLSVTEHRLAIRAQGSYEQITGFIRKMAANARGVRVDAVAVSAGETGKVELELKVSLLFFAS